MTVNARLLLIGPPGSGKGTQAALLAEKFGIPAISTGDIFRYNVSNKTALGKLAKSFMDKGEYVPDSVTNDLVRDRLSQDDVEHGFLLDGYPRTIDQVTELDAILSAADHALDAVVLLVADADETVARMLARAATQGRSDDNEEIIRRRLEVYAAETEPLVAVYSQRGLVTEVDGLGEIGEVTDRIVSALAGRGLV